ncbi:MAG: tRNA (adenosine(37)-N6)-threonylcarbamoyltransferase complex dimerization subunit type 1 TsaB [Candidatus Bipolaricaulota bacterium]|nr:tRNA (adenosine(37)-N6)-threonylcarbamoyltransferase complex dimerization subunit type 1 TsaB [Candidatus Bipolaricaulota bacterium]
MITLGLDTSEVWGGVALWDGATVVDEAMTKERFQHAEGLLPLVENLLVTNKLVRHDIELVSVNRGPGSFTGLRIGIATAKGLSQSMAVPLVGVDGPYAYRAQVGDAAHVCVIIPNRRDLVYIQWFDNSRPVGSPRVIDIERLTRRLAGIKRGILLAGSAVEQLRDHLGALAGVSIAASEVNHPSPAWIARLGERKYTQDETYSLEPIYVERPSVHN